MPKIFPRRIRSELAGVSPCTRKTKYLFASLRKTRQGISLLSWVQLPSPVRTCITTARFHVVFACSLCRLRWSLLLSLDIPRDPSIGEMRTRAALTSRVFSFGSLVYMILQYYLPGSRGERAPRELRSIGPWIPLIFMKTLYLYAGGNDNYILARFSSFVYFLASCLCLCCSRFRSRGSYRPLRGLTARPRTHRKKPREIYRDAIARGQPFLPWSYINPPLLDVVKETSDPPSLFSLVPLAFSYIRVYVVSRCITMVLYDRCGWGTKSGTNKCRTTDISKLKNCQC